MLRESGGTPKPNSQEFETARIGRTQASFAATGQLRLLGDLVFIARPLAASAVATWRRGAIPLIAGAWGEGPRTLAHAPCDRLELGRIDSPVAVEIVSRLKHALHVGRYLVR
jgi:hypothetical protein